VNQKGIGNPNGGTECFCACLTWRKHLFLAFSVIAQKKLMKLAVFKFYCEGVQEAQRFFGASQVAFFFILFAYHLQSCKKTVLRKFPNRE